MEVIKIITTVFDALFLCLVLWVGSTAKERKTIGTSIWMMVIIVFNLFCMWG